MCRRTSISAYVVDAWAKEEPDKKALVWVNEEDEEHIFTFTEIMRKSNQVANYLKGLGFKKVFDLCTYLASRFSINVVKAIKDTVHCDTMTNLIASGNSRDRKSVV